MSERLRNKKASEKAAMDALAKLRREHTTYLACLIAIENYPGELTVADVKRVVRMALHPEEQVASPDPPRG